MQSSLAINSFLPSLCAGDGFTDAEAPVLIVGVVASFIILVLIATIALLVIVLVRRRRKRRTQGRL